MWSYNIIGGAVLLGALGRVALEHVYGFGGVLTRTRWGYMVYTRSVGNVKGSFLRDGEAELSGGDAGKKVVAAGHHGSGFDPAGLPEGVVKIT